MPKYLQARAARDEGEERQVRKLAGAITLLPKGTKGNLPEFSLPTHWGEYAGSSPSEEVNEREPHQKNRPQCGSRSFNPPEQRVAYS